MYLIVSSTGLGTGNQYWGPFPTELRANEYAQSFTPGQKWIIEPLIVPYATVVHRVEWVKS